MAITDFINYIELVFITNFIYVNFTQYKFTNEETFTFRLIVLFINAFEILFYYTFFRTSIIRVFITIITLLIICQYSISTFSDYNLFTLARYQFITWITFRTTWRSWALQAHMTTLNTYIIFNSITQLASITYSNVWWAFKAIIIITWFTQIADNPIAIITLNTNGRNWTFFTVGVAWNTLTFIIRINNIPWVTRVTDSRDITR